MARKTAPKKASKTVGPTDLTAKAQAALEECMKQEKGHERKRMEFYGDGKAAQQVRKLILNKELAPFWAKHFKVTQERFEQWRDYQAPTIKGGVGTSLHQCTTVTKSGRQCARKADRAYIPLAFFKGFTDCCDQHKRRLSRDEQVELYRFDLEMSKAEAEFTADNPREAVKQLSASIRENLS